MIGHRGDLAWLVWVVLIWPGLVQSQVTPWVDISLRDGHLFLETEIAGISGESLFDTGASFNAINENFVDVLESPPRQGKKIEIWGVVGADMRNTYLNVPVMLLGAELEFTDLVGLEIGDPRYQLILGAGFLQLLIFQIDYPNQRVRAMSRDTIDLRKQRNVESRQDPLGGAPLVRARLNDEDDVWLLIDTGSNGGIFLDRKIAEKRGWLGRYDSLVGSTTGVNTSGDTENFNLPVMEFGGYTINNPIITVPAEGEEVQFFARQSVTGTRLKRNYRQAEGILGYDILKHFVVTIDYKTGYVHVAPGEAE